MRRSSIALGFGLVVAAGPAWADPCKAIPDDPGSRAELRSPREVAGPVVYVGDGDSLCVADEKAARRDPKNWVEIRLADFYAPELSEPGGREAKAALVGIAMGRRVSCRGARYSYDRLVAKCRIDGGESLGELMRRDGVRAGGHGR